MTPKRTPERPMTLDECAAKYSLSQETVDRLKWRCADFQRQAENKPTRSVSDRLKRLKDAEANARALGEFLDVVVEAPEDSSALFNALGAPLRLDEGRPVPAADVARWCIRQIELAARDTYTSLRARSGAGGRPDQSESRLALVATIACAVAPHEIKASKSPGRFLNICNACFLLARIPAGAEGPVRRFNKESAWRREYRERGWCL